MRSYVVSYVKPPEFVGAMVDAGESKAFLSTRDTLIRWRPRSR